MLCPRRCTGRRGRVGSGGCGHPAGAPISRLYKSAVLSRAMSRGLTYQCHVARRSMAPRNTGECRCRVLCMRSPWSQAEGAALATRPGPIAHLSQRACSELTPASHLPVARRHGLVYPVQSRPLALLRSAPAAGDPVAAAGHCRALDCDDSAAMAQGVRAARAG